MCRPELEKSCPNEDGLGLTETLPTTVDAVL